MPKSDVNSSRSASSDDEDSKGKGGIFANAEDNLDCDITGDGGAASLSGKQVWTLRLNKFLLKAFYCKNPQLHGGSDPFEGSAGGEVSLVS